MVAIMTTQGAVEWLRWFGIKDKDIQKLQEIHGDKFESIAMRLTPQQKLLVKDFGYNKFCSHMLYLDVKD